MIFGIVGVMEGDVIMEEPAAHRMVAELPMHQRLRKRHDRMRRDGGHEKEWKLRKEPRYRLVHHLFLRLKRQSTLGHAVSQGERLSLLEGDYGYHYLLFSQPSVDGCSARASVVACPLNARK